MLNESLIGAADGLPATALLAACARRRAALSGRLGRLAALIPAGVPASRNYPGNTYAFRASSHFLYLVGHGLEGAVVLLDEAGATLFVPERDAFDDLWHGPLPGRAALAAALGLEVRALSELSTALGDRIPALTPCMHAQGLASVRAVRAARPVQAKDADHALALAMIALRLVHDAEALTELRRAASVSVAAHRAGMAATRGAGFEREVCAAMEAVCGRAGFGTAYGSIVTVHGEVLHNHHHHHALQAGDLLLADVGSESDTGYASDITRTWPVSGRFSSSQRELYELVLAMQEAAIAKLAPGVRYRDVHLTAARVLVDGLCQLGVLRGEVDALVEDGTYALFFPHGVGHLLGLDVHDMEDLGDLAGYASGRVRSQQFGLSYLRLDRDLEPGMVVTVEPGFYQVPSLLADPARVGLRADAIDRTRLARYADVRGIRIEDDVLVTTAGPEVLTAALEKSPDQVERLVLP
ncbi:MAG: aminopeptidase P family protein [Myxococcales bacterium]